MVYICIYTHTIYRYQCGCRNVLRVYSVSRKECGLAEATLVSRMRSLNKQLWYVWYIWQYLQRINNKGSLVINNCCWGQNHGNNNMQNGRAVVRLLLADRTHIVTCKRVISLENGDSLNIFVFKPPEWKSLHYHRTARSCCRNTCSLIGWPMTTTKFRYCCSYSLCWGVSPRLPVGSERDRESFDEAPWLNVL